MISVTTLNVAYVCKASIDKASVRARVLVLVMIRKRAIRVSAAQYESRVAALVSVLEKNVLADPRLLPKELAARRENDFFL